MTRLNSRGFVGALLAFSVFGVMACSSGSGGQGPFADGGAGTGAAEGGTTSSADTSCKSSYPASQSLSAPCCTERGPDACGAGLFCAAFDGRTQATCYPDHARLGGESCTADVQCLGNACDASGVCKGAPGGKCSVALGCGKSLDSDLQFYCDVTASGGPSCRACSQGSIDPVCGGSTKDGGSTPPGKCVPTCTIDADCQASCPVSSAVACCDGATGVCFLSGGGKCPGR